MQGVAARQAEAAAVSAAENYGGEEEGVPRGEEPAPALRVPAAKVHVFAAVPTSLLPCPGEVPKDTNE